MLTKILRHSIYHPILTIALTLVCVLGGALLLPSLPIDAIPDITNVQVQLNTEAPGYTPLEVEQQISLPLERSFAGIPRLDMTRSLSRYGLSQITLVFEEGTDIYFARQLLSERLTGIKDLLPPGISPKLGPIATGLGEIVTYSLQYKDGCQTLECLSELRTMQDWIIAPQLKTLPGVNEVNSIGGYQKQLFILPDPQKLLSYGLFLHDIETRIEIDNRNIGAGYVEENGEQVLMRIPLREDSVGSLTKLVIAERKGVPIHLEDVATVRLDEELRTGAATQDGKEVVLGTVMMLIGSNSRSVTAAIENKLDEIKLTLPDEIKLEISYTRSKLVDATISTVRRNLLEAALLVIAVLFFLLGNFRASCITACIIPFSLLLTTGAMRSLGISANLMSLGALDFGLLIDGAVILVERAVSQLASTGPVDKNTRKETILNAAIEVRKATLFGELTIMSVYLPVLTLGGVEGKMFIPMAATVILALAFAMVLSLTFIPAAVSLFLPNSSEEHEPRVIGWLRSRYALILQRSLNISKSLVVCAVFIMLVTVSLFFIIGKEFLPELDEGDFAVHALRIPGTSLTQAIEMQHFLEEAFARNPEVKQVFTKIGTAEIANDPMPPSVADCYVILKPRSEWPNPTLSTESLTERMRSQSKDIIGNQYEFTQPIRMRMNELLAGVRADIALKIFGDDLSELQELGEKARQIVAEIPGAADVSLEQIDGLPVREFNLNREKLAQFGLWPGVVQEYLQTALAGKEVSALYDGDVRIPVLLRLPKRWRSDTSLIEQIPLPLPMRGNEESDSAHNAPEELGIPFIPLKEVSTFTINEGINQISREDSKRRIVLSINVEGTDLVGFIETARERLVNELDLKSGYWLHFGGQYQNFLAARNRLLLVIPLTLIIVVFLVYLTLQSIRNTALALTGIPFALTGGIVALLLRGIALSISAAVGFIALAGVAVLNGLVLLSALAQKAEDSSEDLTKEDVIAVAVSRLRPVLMTALVASLGFLPMATSTGMGAEVQRPLATVVIGGILSSSLLTLVVLPCLWWLSYNRKNNS